MFHLLIAPPGAGRSGGSPPRRLSLPGARILAGQLRDAAVRRQELAAARVGLSRACAFDLHALCRCRRPCCGTAPTIRRRWPGSGSIGARPSRCAMSPRTPPPTNGARTPAKGEAAWVVTFWSANWTPWRALAQIAADWPALRFDTRPSYDRP